MLKIEFIFEKKNLLNINLFDNIVKFIITIFYIFIVMR
jgi:hypothetical protein